MASNDQCNVNVLSKHRLIEKILKCRGNVIESNGLHSEKLFWIPRIFIKKIKFRNSIVAKTLDQPSMLYDCFLLN